MEELYIKIELVLMDSLHSFLREQGSSAGSFVLHLKITETIILEHLIKILQCLNDAKKRLGKPH